MTTIFITGERSLPPAAAFMIVAPVLAALLKEDKTLKFVTGDAPHGVERAVRFLVDEKFLTVIKRGKDADGKIDLDSSALEASKIADEAIVIHPKPDTSRVLLSVHKNFKKVSLPLQGLVKEEIISDDEKATFESMVAGLNFDEPKE